MSTKLEESAVTIKSRRDQPHFAPVLINQYKVALESQHVLLFLSFNSGFQSLVNLLWLVNKNGLSINKAPVLQFYERLVAVHSGDTPLTESQFTPANPQVFYGHYIDFAHYGDLAQIKLASISIYELSEASRTEHPFVESVTRSIADMSTLLQLAIIRSLYIGIGERQ